MLTRYPDRVVVHTAVVFEPDIRFHQMLTEEAAFVQSKIKAKYWTYGPEVYILRDTEKRYFVALGNRALQFTGLGLSTWIAGRTEYARMFVHSLKAIGVEKLIKASFKTTAFLPIDMSFAEISTLVFGSFLVEATELEPILGKATDAWAQIHSTYKGLKTVTTIAPQNVDQVSQTFMGIPNIEHLLEPKMYDTGLKEFRDRIAIDCLMVETELSIENAQIDAIDEFTKKSLDAADEIAAAAVARLRKIPAKKVTM